ncbi:MAG: hypothetical protein IKL44_02650 [Clostridia bacterium]|nr:hypothetical protein [Clostridia bacterium]
MNINALKHLYSQAYTAAEELNESADKFEIEPFHLDGIYQRFNEDMLAITHWVISATGGPLDSQIDRFNEMFEVFGLQLPSKEVSAKIASDVAAEGYLVPHTLNLIATRSHTRLLTCGDDKRMEQHKEECRLLGLVLCIYTDLMCSMITEDSVFDAAEKAVREFIQKSIDFMCECLVFGFELTYDLDAIIDEKRPKNA